MQMWHANRLRNCRGELASDLGAEAGPYAKMLAEEIVKPGVEAVAMFRRMQVRATIALAGLQRTGRSSRRRSRSL